MKKLETTVTIAKRENASDESHYLTFKVWEKGDKRRIYINDYKRRTLGYIENGDVIINDRQGNYQEEIDYAIANLRAEYEI